MKQYIAGNNHSLLNFDWIRFKGESFRWQYSLEEENNSSSVFSENAV